MAVKNEKLILEIGGPEVSAEKFEQGIRSFLKVLKDVSQAVSGTIKGIRWAVEVEPACIRMIYKPIPEESDSRDILVVLDTVESGFKSLESGEQRPKYFTDNAARHAKSLANILDHKKNGIDTIKVWRNGRSNQISYNTVTTVNSLFKSRYQDWGSLTGKLSVISEKQRLKFFIIDPITKDSIRCNFEEDMVEDVLSAFRHRVEASGLIKYRKDGSPISIEVEEFYVFPDSADLPKPRDVRGILRGVS